MSYDDAVHVSTPQHCEAGDVGNVLVYNCFQVSVSWIESRMAVSDFPKLR